MAALAPLSPVMRGIRKLLGRDGPLVPIVRLEGVIAPGGRGNALNLAKVEKLLARAFAPGSAAAVAILVNSPGGSPVQSKLIHDRIRALAEEKDKTVLVFCEDVAASGGYMIACAGDEIFCDASSIMGSIGVISASFGFTGAMEKIGVERRLRTAGKNKSLSDPFSEETEEQRTRLERLMNRLHTHFIDLVKTRRSGKLDESDEELFTGQVYTGDEAVENGLADHLGEVRSVLKSRYGKDVRTRLLTVPKGGMLSRLLGQSAANFAETLENREIWSRYGL